MFVLRPGQQWKQEVEGREIDMLKSYNKVLEEKCERMYKDMSVVDWYINVMEGGVDVTEAMKNYAKAFSVQNNLLYLSSKLTVHKRSHNGGKPYQNKYLERANYDITSIFCF